MEPVVFGAVLLAAAMHAGWNAVVKVGLDRLSSMTLLALSSALICAALLPFFPLPAVASLPWLIASALIHTGYKLTLVKAYEHGDLSQVYPLARGTAPLIVAVASTAFLGETVTLAKLAAILLIGFGVCIMSFRHGAADRIPLKALGFALATAAFTASYTLVDGLGARISGSASGYIIGLSIVDGICTCACVFALRGTKILKRLAPAWRSGLTAGAMSLASYWIAIWAFTQAPIALVAALRESSVLFAVLFAVLFLKERAGPVRIAAAGMIACGVIVMRL
ncbi:EamA family transporter [Microvirga rosea]|uniref:EamA family transporter n=1 Tax=Microvirga rosea TaxID=2715425 RepID=UPI001D09B2F3|nr:EamA family transporter [Microvirga rosea]MCB8821650.1 EamA family transporter [Microvirga rosea]